MAMTSGNQVKARVGRLLPLVAITAMLLTACGTSTQTASPTGTAATGAATAMTGAGEGAATAMTNTGEGAATAGTSAATAVTGAGQGAATAMTGVGEGAATAMVGAATAVTGAGQAAATNVAGTINGSQLSVEMGQQNSSNESGKATLTDMGNGKIKVVLELNNGTTEPQPAHIHKGSCANLDPNPLIPLNNVVNGKSETEVDATMDALSGNTAINVHKSAAEASTYVSCGDIKGTPGMMNGTPGMMQATPGMMDATPGMMQATPGAMDTAPGMVSGTPGLTTMGTAVP